MSKLTLPVERLPKNITAILVIADFFAVFLATIIFLNFLSPEQLPEKPKIIHADAFFTNFRIPDCTLFASPGGNDNNQGTSVSSPKTLSGASKITVPGDTVCLLDGTYNLATTFYPYHNGTASAYITYRSYNPNGATLLWTADSNAVDKNMFHFYGSDFASGKSYIQVIGLNLDGQNIAANGFKCFYSHHISLINNFIKNTGASGIATKWCDYVYADHNSVFHNGYVQGWTSGISFNSNQWLDRAAGFHSYAVNNIVSGEFDNSTYISDGNGIIMDLSNNTYDASSANTPPVLVANNLVYENGGRCIEIFTVSNIWVVNNTCYKNALDTREAGIGEMVTNQSKDSYFVNNIVYSWNNRNTFQQFGVNSNISYYQNMYFGGVLNFTPSLPQLFYNTEPLFVSPLGVDPVAGGQYAYALSPSLITNQLQLQNLSPAIDRGVDPVTLTTDPTIQQQLNQFTGKDIRYLGRPQGALYDLGAYEYVLGSTPSPSALTPTQGITPTAILDNVIPSIAVLAPVNGSTVDRNSNVVISANANDNIAVAKVDFYVNGTLKCSDLNLNYFCTFKTSGKSGMRYLIKVKAYDQAGNSNSTSISIITK